MDDFSLSPRRTGALGPALHDVGAVFRVEKKPVAEWFLSGPVNSAEVEVQRDSIVIALSHQYS